MLLPEVSFLGKRLTCCSMTAAKLGKEGPSQPTASVSAGVRQVGKNMETGLETPGNYLQKLEVEWREDVRTVTAL